jgi:hypothetical protein
MALSSLERAIVLTISYPDQFSYPLTESEIWQRLPLRISEWWTVQTKIPTRPLVQLALKRLVKKQIIETDSEYFWLAGRSFLVDRRHRRQRISQNKWQEVDTFINFARKVPWISAVFVTGSLAMNNADQDDDSDFMIVTQPHRLWLTRLIVSLYAMIKGKRRSWQGEEKRSWCFNLWLEESAFPILAEECSVYKAYELIQAQPVFDRGGVEKRLMSATAWVKQFLPNVKWTGTRKTIATSNSTSGWLTKLNQISYELQHWYMIRHMTRERVTEQYAFFHPRDTQGSILDGWVTSLTTHE